jgi:hypothetical protein
MDIAEKFLKQGKLMPTSPLDESWKRCIQEWRPAQRITRKGVIYGSPKSS